MAKQRLHFGRDKASYSLCVATNNFSGQKNNVYFINEKQIVAGKMNA